MAFRSGGVEFGINLKLPNVAKLREFTNEMQKLKKLTASGGGELGTGPLSDKEQYRFHQKLNKVFSQIEASKKRSVDKLISEEQRLAEQSYAIHRRLNAFFRKQEQERVASKRMEAREAQRLLNQHMREQERAARHAQRLLNQQIAAARQLAREQERESQKAQRLLDQHRAAQAKQKMSFHNVERSNIDPRKTTMGPVFGVGKDAGKQMDANWMQRTSADWNDWGKKDAQVNLWMTKQMKEFGKASKNASGDVNDLVNAVHAAQYAMAAFGLHAISRQIEDFARESTILAGRIETLGIVMQNVAANAGYTRAEIESLQHRVESFGITTRHAREAITLLARNNLELEKSTKLARVAQDAAVIAGENSSQTYEKIAIAVQRLDTRMLRTQGILINLRPLYQRMAMETGRVETTLTSQEKQQLLLNEVLAKGVSIQGSYISSMQSVHKQFLTLERLTEQARMQLGQKFMPVFKLYVDAVGGLSEWYINLNEGSQTFMASLVAFASVAGRAAVVLFSLKGAMAAYAIASEAAAASTAQLGIAAGVLQWKVLPIAAVIGGIALAFTLLSNAANDAKQAWDEQVLKVHDTTIASVNLREAWIAAEKAMRSNDGSYMASERLRTAMQNLRDAANDAKNSIGDVTDAYVALNKIAVNAPEVRMTDVEYFRELEDRIAKAREEIDKLREASSRPPTVAGPAAGWREQMQIEIMEAEEQLKLLLEERDARAEATAAKEVRRLTRMAEKQNVAYQLALRAESTFQGERERMFKNSAMGMLFEAEEYTKKLATTYMSDKDIVDLNAKSWEALSINQRRNYEQLMKDETDIQKLNNLKSEMLRTLSEQQQAINDQTLEQLDAQRKIVEMYEMQLWLTNEKINAQKIENDAVFEKNARLDAGDFEDSVEAEQKAREIVREMQKAQDELTKKFAGDEAQSAILEKRRVALETQLKLVDDQKKEAEKSLATLREQNAGADEITLANERVMQLRNSWSELNGELQDTNASLLFAKKGLQATLEDLMAAKARGEDVDDRLRVVNDQIKQAVKIRNAAYSEGYAGLEEIYGDLSRSVKKEMEETVDKIKDMEQAIRDLEGDTTAHTGEQVRKRIEERKKEYEEVEDFIRSIRVELNELRMPGGKEVAKIADQFTENVKKAQNDKQLRELATLFPKKFKLAMEDTRKDIDELDENIIQKRAEAARAMQEAWSDVRTAKTRQQYFNAQQRFLEVQRKQTEALQELEKKRAEKAKELTQQTRFQAEAQGSLNREIEAQKRVIAEVEKEKAREKKILEDEKAVAVEKLNAEKQSLEIHKQTLDYILKQRDAIKEMYSTLNSFTGASPTPPMPQAPTLPSKAKPQAPEPTAPKPAPAPEPSQKPAPAPEPAQKPAQKPAPEPSQKPAQKPAPEPSQKPAPAPEPAPEPAQKPAPADTFRQYTDDALEEALSNYLNLYNMNEISLQEAYPLVDRIMQEQKRRAAAKSAPPGRFGQYTDAALADELEEYRRQYNRGEISDTETANAIHDIIQEQKRRAAAKPAPAVPAGGAFGGAGVQDEDFRLDLTWRYATERENAEELHKKVAPQQHAAKKNAARMDQINFNRILRQAKNARYQEYEERQAQKAEQYTQSKKDRGDLHMLEMRRRQLSFVTGRHISLQDLVSTMGGQSPAAAPGAADMVGGAGMQAAQTLQAAANATSAANRQILDSYRAIIDAAVMLKDDQDEMRGGMARGAEAAMKKLNRR